MIRPPGLRAAAFALAADGDARHDRTAREAIAFGLGIPAAWGWARQVHGADVLLVTAPGDQGDGDALLTDTVGVPLAVTTADCVPIVVEGRTSVAVVHAGWRGLAAGVVAAALSAMRAVGDAPVAAAIGPAIGPCCYEVGDEVAGRFTAATATTTWGAKSVDLRAAAVAQLPGVPVWVSERCTMTDPELNSHRRDGTKKRQVTVAWLPPS